MIHTDGSQYCHLRGSDQIGSIFSAAHTGLQYDDITLFFLEIPKGQCRLDLKRCRMMEAVTYHSITMFFYDPQSFTQILMRDLLLSDLDFFTIFNNNR